MSAVPQGQGLQGQSLQGQWLQGQWLRAHWRDADRALAVRDIRILGLCLCLGPGRALDVIA
jgi:hypothetical protein